MKEIPMIDAFDTADFNPELILSSVFLDSGLDFVTNIDDIGDNIIGSDLLQQLGSTVFYTDNITPSNNCNSGSVAGNDVHLQHSQIQMQQHNHQQQQHLALHQASSMLLPRSRVSLEPQKPTDEMHYESFSGDYTKPQLAPTIPLAMMVPQPQQQQQQPCKCEFCEYLQANRISLTGDHLFQCEFCGEGFSNQTSFNNHRCGSTDIQTYRCENCHQEYGGSRALSNSSHCEPKGKCDICHRSYVQSLPEEQAAYGPLVETRTSPMAPRSTAAPIGDVTGDSIVMAPTMILTSPEHSTGSDTTGNTNVCSIANSPIEQNALSSIDPFESDSESLGKFFAADLTSGSPGTTSPASSANTNTNIESLLQTTSLHHPESAKTYFILGNVEQLQQMHAAANVNQPSTILPATNGSLDHGPEPSSAPGLQQPLVQPTLLQSAAPASTSSLLSCEHEVTSLQQYDHYDDEDYSSMSEDEAIVPIEPYAKSPNQDHAKTELPIQETIVDTSTGVNDIPVSSTLALGGQSRDNALADRLLVAQGVAQYQHIHHQYQQQALQQQTNVSNSAVSATRPDDDEDGKCDSSSSLGMFTGTLQEGTVRESDLQATHSSASQSFNPERPYKCHICERSYRNQKNLKSHLKVHEGIRAYQCEICGKNFSGSSYLVIHRRRHTGERPFKCSTCGKAFVDSRALAVHTRLHSGERLKCEKCEKTFSSVSALTVHNRLHTGIHPYKCDLCGKTFPQYNNLKHHMKKHDQANTPEKQPQLPNRTMLVAAQLANGVSTTNGAAGVPGCLESVQTEGKINGNGHMVASSTTCSSYEYKCHICNKLYKSSGDLQEHLGQHSKDRPNQCEFCSKVFPRSSHLIIHRRRHTGERPFKCKYCDKAFVDSRALSVHTRLHTGERVKCEICEKTFASSSGLIVHRRIHTGVHPYKCDYCEKSFAQSTALKYHLKKHDTALLPTTTTPERGEAILRYPALSQNGKADLNQETPCGEDSAGNGNNRYKCPVCGKCFRSSEYLVRHRRTHSGERPYQCEICGKNFSTMSYLVIHRRRHTSERPYKCTSCEKAFVDSRALQEHARLHTGDRVRCEICQKTYSSVSNLIVHRRIHSGIHPFECDSCGKSFAQKNALKYHLKKHIKQN